MSTCSVEVIQLSLSKQHTTSPCSANRINLLACRRANWGTNGSDLRATGGALGPGARLAKMSDVKQATALKCLGKLGVNLGLILLDAKLWLQ